MHVGDLVPSNCAGVGGEDEIAGEMAGDVDPATMDASGPDSAVVQDDEEVEMMRQEQMEEGDAQHEAGDNGEDDEEE